MVCTILLQILHYIIVSPPRPAPPPSPEGLSDSDAVPGGSERFAAAAGASDDAATIAPELRLAHVLRMT